MPTNTPESPSADQAVPPEGLAASRSSTPPEVAPHDVKERFRQSREYRHALTTLVVLGIFTGVSLLTALFSSIFVVDDSESFDFDRRWWLLPACSAALGLLLAVLIFVRWSIANREWEDRLDDEEKENLRRKLEEQLPQTDQKLQRLIDANRALLDKYQEPVRKQARTSYAYAQGAITVGFLLVLLVGAGITVAASDTPTQVGIAALTGVGTVLSGHRAHPTSGCTYTRSSSSTSTFANHWSRVTCSRPNVLQKSSRANSGIWRTAKWSRRLWEGLAANSARLSGTTPRRPARVAGNACCDASPRTQLRTKTAARSRAGAGEGPAPHGPGDYLISPNGLEPGLVIVLPTFAPKASSALNAP